MVTNHPAGPLPRSHRRRWGSHVPDTLHQAVTLLSRGLSEDKTVTSYGTASSSFSVNSNPLKFLSYCKQLFLDRTRNGK